MNDELPEGTDEILTLEELIELELSELEATDPYEMARQIEEALNEDDQGA